MRCVDIEATPRGRTSRVLAPPRGCNEANFVTKPRHSASQQCFVTNRFERATLGNVVTKRGHDPGLASRPSNVEVNHDLSTAICPRPRLRQRSYADACLGPSAGCA